MKEWSIRLCLMVFAFLISAVALEFGLSKFAPNTKTIPSTPFMEPDEYIGWKGIPGKETKYVRGRIVSYIKINSHGFRDRERTLEKKDGVFRILALGDSFTEGSEVLLEQTYPYILEEKLNSEGSRKFEVINLGVRAFGTDQEYLTLKHYGLKYHPDFVILNFFIGNDVKDNSLVLQGKGEGRGVNDRIKPFFVLNKGELEELPFTIHISDPSKDKKQTSGGATKQSRIVKGFLMKVFPNIYYSLDDRIRETPWLTNLLWRIGVLGMKYESLHPPDESEKDEINIYAEQYTPEWQDAWEVTKALILRVSTELKGDNIGFLVVIIPDRLEVGLDLRGKEKAKEKLDLEKPEQILSEFLKKNGISYVQLLPEFKKYFQDTGKTLYFTYKDEAHWNADGHALAAELVYKKLRNDKIVPP